MSAIQSKSPITEEQLTPAPLLRTLAVCDLVESTALIEQLGERGVAEVIHRLDREARDLIASHNGREIDKTDGFLVLFERPIQAVACALDFQRLLRRLGSEELLPLTARVGIHVGDVVLWENSAEDIERGAKPLEVEGLVKPVAARLMSLARPGQILLSGMAHQLAQRAEQELPGNRDVQWREHGRYLFKGVAEAQYVYEVGETGIAPFKTPPYSSKAYREIPWWRRPAALAVQAALLLTALAVPAWTWLRSPPALAFAQRDWVVVGDLKNLTRETSFNDSLQTAFRLGLEQSRYVNVLSDLKVRDTLALMKRDSKSARVDRAIGSEIAIRDGARALILPTVAEVGGKVRVSAEVIDPRTQATVYTESAEGRGADSVLHLVDIIDQQLRLRLGEALASVQQQSRPLDQAATSSLDALRAYSLANTAYDDGRYKDSEELYLEAIKLDPKFGLARVHLARTLLVEDRQNDAIQMLDSVDSTHSNFAPRDRMYFEAMRESVEGSQRDAVAKWRALAALYPDYFVAQSSYAFYSLQFDNRFGKNVLDAAKRGASTKNPHLAPDLWLLGTLYLANEQYKESERTYAKLHQVNKKRHFYTALPYAAQRDFSQAYRELQFGHPNQSTAQKAIRYIPLIALSFDQGNYKQGWEVLKQARKDAETYATNFELTYRAMEVGLRTVLEPKGASANDLDNYAKFALDTLRKSSGTYESEVGFLSLYGAYLAAHASNLKLANRLIREVSAKMKIADYPMLGKMMLLAKSRILLAHGKPGNAIKLLNMSLDGSELYLTHAVLMDAYSAANQSSSANQQARWLSRHRGRAYAEYNVRATLMPINVTISNLAQKKFDQHQATK